MAAIPFLRKCVFGEHKYIISIPLLSSFTCICDFGKLQEHFIFGELNMHNFRPFLV